MLQIRNNTRFAASMALFPNEDAVDTLYVMVKASFNFDKAITLANEQSPLVAADVYWTEPGKSSLKYASDMHTGKPSTDIVMLGHACPPGQKETREMDVSLSVGKVSKSARVYGDRQWKDGKITAPTAFKTMAMVYEKAYGGLYIQEGQIADADTRNPVGRGFAGKRSSKDMNGVPLPNLEDPSRLIQKHDDQPAVAGFGFCAPNWQPRVSHAGTYDEHWKTNRAPYLPEDFDSRFLNMAHPDLVYPGFAQGGELVSIQGMHPRGSLEFEIPQVGLVTRVQMADTEYLPLLNLETIILEPNALRISMVWRAALPCDKKALKVSEIKINLTS